MLAELELDEILVPEGLDAADMKFFLCFRDGYMTGYQHGHHDGHDQDIYDMSSIEIFEAFETFMESVR